LLLQQLDQLLLGAYVAADFADVENKFQRFIGGELFGDMLLSAAHAAGTAAQALPRKTITAMSGTGGTAPVTFTTADHQLTNTDRIRLAGATRVEFSLPVG
jgi:hypothetical protein